MFDKFHPKKAPKSSQVALFVMLDFVGLGRLNRAVKALILLGLVECVSSKDTYRDTRSLTLIHKYRRLTLINHSLIDSIRQDLGQQGGMLVIIYPI